MPENGADGFLNVNKPLRLTSHDVVARARRHYRALTGSKKVGHAGTLDPLADGVLVLCLGAATRLSEYIMRSRKVYRATLELGKSTSTYDGAGDVLERRCADHVTLADIEGALPRFLGEIQQTPPMHSAIKVGGKKLYELARQGQTIERQPRPVTIQAINLLSWRNPFLALEVQCGAGTYIRSLAHDLGAELGVGASLAGLTRTASGSFKLERSLDLDTIDEGGDWLARLVSPYDALAEHRRVTLGRDEIDSVRRGRFIPREPAIDDQTVFAFDAAGRLAAILEPRKQLWKPRKVFHSQS